MSASEWPKATRKELTYLSISGVSSGNLVAKLALHCVRRTPRGVKRKMSNFPLRPRHVKPLPKIDIRKAIRIIK